MHAACGLQHACTYAMASFDADDATVTSRMRVHLRSDEETLLLKLHGVCDIADSIVHDNSGQGSERDG